MGQIVSRIKQPFHIATESVAQIVRGRKRKHEEEDSSDEITTALEKSLQVPKRKKLLTTTQYIYQALFKEQKNSDVTVMALGKSWYLHKVYLCQSPYFFSMFNGSWKESCQNFVHIKILDPKITLESLDAVFGSLYLDEIVIEPLSVISVLATARLFQLDGLIDKCAEVMIETTNAETAVPYYEAGCQYGVQNVKKAAFDWLLVNLLSFYNKHTKWLKLINCDLMTDLISSPDLYVMQTEFSAYALLRLWMFLKLFPDYELLNNSNNNNNNSPNTNTNMNSVTGNNNNKNGDKNSSNTINVRNVSSSTNNNNNNNNNSATIIKTNKSSTSTSTSSSSSSSLIKCDNLTPQNYFENRKNSTPFLLTQDGYEFCKPFKALRIQHLLNHHVDLKLVIEDNIIPKEWLHHHLLGHWNSILKIDHALELDPCNVDDDIFLKNSIRFGRVLPEYGYHKWRWTGFNFGLDLVIIVDEKTLCIKRHHRADNQRLLSLRTKRQFLIRVNVSSLNEQRQTFRTQATGIKSLQLEKNEEQALMLLDKELSYPLLISVNLLFISPDKKLNYMISNLINDNGNNGYSSNNNNNNDGINSQVPISEIGANFVDASINASSSSSSSLPAMVTNNPSSFESEL